MISICEGRSTVVNGPAKCSFRLLFIVTGLINAAFATVSFFYLPSDIVDALASYISLFIGVGSFFIVILIAACCDRGELGVNVFQVSLQYLLFFVGFFTIVTCEPEHGVSIINCTWLIWWLIWIIKTSIFGTTSQTEEIYIYYIVAFGILIVAYTLATYLIINNSHVSHQFADHGFHYDAHTLFYEIVAMTLLWIYGGVWIFMAVVFWAIDSIQVNNPVISFTHVILGIIHAVMLMIEVEYGAEDKIILGVNITFIMMTYMIFVLILFSDGYKDVAYKIRSTYKEFVYGTESIINN